MKIKPIAELDLSRFERPVIAGNPALFIRAVWYVTNALLFRSSLLGLLPSSVKASILRSFGARVGRGLVMKPRVDIKSPWFLEVGDHVWLGERVWIDNHTTVRIGSNVCISQGAYIFTGNHDWSEPTFTFFCKPVTIGDCSWITAFSKLGPGTVVPMCSVFLAP
jgi:putative colanic acid biosynthesis acetyltransferase WcaF